MEISNISKKYGSRFSLSIDSLNIVDNSKVAILGANGSGKSTFLKILCGIVKNDGEKAEISSFGYLPQQSFAFDKTVIGNVETALWDVPKKERLKRAENALKITDLIHLKNEKAINLSGGETQRLALARVLARKPKVLILDEPTAACDIESEKKIEEALLNFEGTLLFTTHSPAQALRVADYIIFLDNGKVLEYEKTRKVIFESKNKRAADFMKQWKVNVNATGYNN